METKTENNNYFQSGEQYFDNIDQMIQFAKHLPKSEITTKFISALEETKKKHYNLTKTIKTIGKKTDLPPLGYVRITGAENKSDWNELVKLEDLEKRCKEIFAEYPDEDAYYTDLKFFWLLYDNGKEMQMVDVVWGEK